MMKAAGDLSYETLKSMNKEMRKEKNKSEVYKRSEYEDTDFEARSKSVFSRNYEMDKMKIKKPIRNSSIGVSVDTNTLYNHNV